MYVSYHHLHLPLSSHADCMFNNPRTLQFARLRQRIEQCHQAALAAASAPAATAVAAAAVADAAKKGRENAALPPAARILGLHLEGPFISPERVGAHAMHNLAAPADGLASLSARYSLEDAQWHTGDVRIVTLAPELPGAFSAIHALSSAGVVPSIGHTNADIRCADAAVDRGACLITHLFNAMSAFHHRDPGVVGLLGRMPGRAAAARRQAALKDRSASSSGSSNSNSNSNAAGVASGHCDAEPAQARTGSQVERQTALPERQVADAPQSSSLFQRRRSLAATAGVWVGAPAITLSADPPQLAADDDPHRSHGGEPADNALVPAGAAAALAGSSASGGRMHASRPPSPYEEGYSAASGGLLATKLAPAADDTVGFAAALSAKLAGPHAAAQLAAATAPPPAGAVAGTDGRRATVHPSFHMGSSATTAINSVPACVPGGSGGSVVVGGGGVTSGLASPMTLVTAGAGGVPNGAPASLLPAHGKVKVSPWSPPPFFAPAPGAALPAARGGTPTADTMTAVQAAASAAAHHASSLSHDRPYYSIIVDGVHCHPYAVTVAYETHPRGLICVTDAIRAMGLPVGRHRLGEMDVELYHGMEDGHYEGLHAVIAGTSTLAGAVVPLDKCVRNLRAYTDCSAEHAVDCVTRHPAKLLRLDNVLGNLGTGCWADMVLLDDELHVVQTYLAGQLVWAAPLSCSAHARRLDSACGGAAATVLSPAPADG